VAELDLVIDVLDSAGPVGPGDRVNILFLLIIEKEYVSNTCTVSLYHWGEIQVFSTTLEICPSKQRIRPT
jgi:hypothetical protein